MKIQLARRMAAEFLGTAFLVAAVIGSGIMGERLAGGNAAIALLANTIATGAALVALILAFGPISGAHFNPVVTLADWIEAGATRADAIGYACAQILGGASGAMVANMMFGLTAVSISHHAPRSGAAQMFSEFIATFGLLSVIWGCAKAKTGMAAFAVGGYITAAYWFTASTSFANPVVTIARSLSDTFAGIRPQDVTGFIVAQVAGALAATYVFRWIMPGIAVVAKNVMLPHETEQE
jgi:glycerol uptake facilitator-like aquaporin